MRPAVVARAEETAEGGLGRLIETEARIAQALATCQIEAAALLRAAQEEGEAEERRLGERHEEEIAALTGRIAAERDAEIMRLGAAAEARSGRLRDLPPGQVDELADWVSERVMTEGDPGRQP